MKHNLLIVSQRWTPSKATTHLKRPIFRGPKVGQIRVILLLYQLLSVYYGTLNSPRIFSILYIFIIWSYLVTVSV